MKLQDDYAHAVNFPKPPTLKKQKQEAYNFEFYSRVISSLQRRAKPHQINEPP